MYLSKKNRLSVAFVLYLSESSHRAAYLSQHSTRGSCSFSGSTPPSTRTILAEFAYAGDTVKTNSSRTHVSVTVTKGFCPALRSQGTQISFFEQVLLCDTIAAGVEQQNSPDKKEAEAEGPSAVDVALQPCMHPNHRCCDLDLGLLQAN